MTNNAATAAALREYYVQGEFVMAYVSATQSHNVSLRGLPCSGMATRPLSFGHNLNDTVALYSRVQIELVILSKDKVCAWLR
jgi:hypothetical protein